MARAPLPLTRLNGRIQTSWELKGSGLHGAFQPHTPGTVVQGKGTAGVPGTHRKPIQLPPPYGGEQERKGKGYPNPSKGIRRRSPGTYGGAAVSIGGVETITVQRLSVHGCDPAVLRSERLCEALERFHCGLYPQDPPTELSDA